MAWKKPGGNGDGPDGGRNPWQPRGGNGIGDTARQRQLIQVHCPQAQAPGAA